MHQLKHKGAETLIRNSAELQGSVTARVTCYGEHSTAFRSLFHPAQHCNSRGFWQQQGRALSALLLYIHRQDSLAPPDRDINTILLCLKASQSPQNCPTQLHSQPQTSATSHMNKGQKSTADYLFFQLQPFYQFITLSLTVPIWFVRHSFPYSLLYLAHSWSATCSRRETLGSYTSLLPPPTTHPASSAVPTALSTSVCP